MNFIFQWAIFPIFCEIADNNIHETYTPKAFALVECTVVEKLTDADDID
jgi:hypothetical protein